jgi:phosphate transport system permease protein
MNQHTVSPFPPEIHRPLAPGRSWFDRGMTILSYSLTILALLPLLSLTWEILARGFGSVNWHTLTKDLVSEPTGFGNAIAGTLMIVLIAAIFALPIGIITAIYLSEFGKQTPIAQVVRFAVRIISAVPSIVMGVFAYAVLVISLGKPSALAGSFALAILMLPMVILAVEEALKLIPSAQRAASAALGAGQMHTTMRVVVAPALPGITTAALLAIARAAGETAPLIFTAQFSQNYPDGLLNPSPSLFVLIYNFSNSPDVAQQQLAWGAALVLLMLVLVLNVGARLLFKRSA